MGWRSASSHSHERSHDFAFPISRAKAGDNPREFYLEQVMPPLPAPWSAHRGAPGFCLSVVPCLEILCAAPLAGSVSPPARPPDAPPCQVALGAIKKDERQLAALEKLEQAPRPSASQPAPSPRLQGRFERAS